MSRAQLGVLLILLGLIVALTLFTGPLHPLVVGLLIALGASTLWLLLWRRRPTQ